MPEVLEEQRSNKPPHSWPAGCEWTGTTHIALIHVGKTSGESLEVMLREALVNHTWIHEPATRHGWAAAQWATDCDYTHYIVTTRAPAPAAAQPHRPTRIAPLPGR